MRIFGLMSAHRISVSRSGMTTCPHCSSHIKLATDIAQTSCPFCGAGVLRSRRSRREMLATALGTSAGLALLLGVAGGCKTTSPPQDRPPQPQPAAPDAGSTADVPVEVTPAPEPPPQPEYGMPMPAPEPVVRPMYGLPSPPLKKP